MPDFKIKIRERLAKLGLSPVREAEIVEELSQHLEEEYERALSRGAPDEEARQQVLEELNTTDLLGHELKDVERRVSKETVALGAETKTNIFADISQDLRYGLRTLLKNPGFTIVAVCALALGIGANSAIFSVVNAVLLRPLPFKNPEQLVMVWENAAHQGFPKNTPSPLNFLDWQRQNTVFTGMAAMCERSFNLTGVGEPERVDGRRVSANLFDLLGVPASLGRTFVQEDDRPGAHVVVLSDSLWKRRFGSDPSVIGRAVTLNGESYTVIGVMPRSVHLPAYGNWNDQLWVPIAFTNEEATQRGNHFLDVVARMKPGITLKQAQAEMETIAARLAKEYPKYNMRIGATVTPLHEEIVGDIKPALLILLGAVGFVLLIACANVANLLLARAAVREKEIALRLALGASRFRLTRQFLTESVLLASVGAGFGLLLAVAGVRVLKTFVPSMILQIQTINIDAKVLLFTASVALLTGIAFGLAPALHASHSNLNDSLKEGGRDSSVGGKGNRLRGLLVIAEVAVSFILLIGAGLLINSFLHLRSLDPGFRADHLLTMKVDLPELKYPDGERRAIFFDEVLRRVRALPGVQSVAVAGNLPFTYNGDSATIAVEGIPDPPPDQWPDVIYRAVGPGYFSTMGIPLTRGRDFTDQERTDSKKVVVITERTAQHYWPGQDPTGKRLKMGTSTSNQPWREVVGVVKDVRQNDFIAEPKMQMYFPYRQLKDLAANALVVRTSVEPLSLATSVRNAIWAVDKDQPVAAIDTMDHIVSEAVARQRFTMLLLGLFATLALLLASVGIYGVMSYSVAQRTREIGIRIALGARRSDVLQMTVKQGLKLVGAGMILGLVAAFFLTRVLATLLFGISATDPLTFLGISLVLLVVAVLASYVPALRATRVDPITALRAQ
ncbi:MAG TPA: ABC transporter permease [Candidatus Udaeobacter sp.]|jgi:putative ABC transport system permease protein|nr:ABC transporter permease [Candidatus Udaeobacter sp.]